MTLPCNNKTCCVKKEKRDRLEDTHICVTTKDDRRTLSHEKEEVMKKIAMYLGMGVLAFGLTACGRNGQAEESTQQSVETTVENTVMENDTTDVNDTTDTEMDVTEGWSTEMEGLKSAIVEALGENYWPDMAVPAEVLEGNYGITPDMYDDYLAEMPMISTNVDTLLIIKAKDDKVEAVQEALNTYRESLVNDTMQYPVNVGKIQASRIETIGNYVCFVQLGADTMAASEQGDEAVITHCQEQNELVLEIINQNVQ